jgi:putative oxidoreductase
LKKVRADLHLGQACLLVIIATAVALLYNSFGGIALISPERAAMSALGQGLPEQDGIHLVGLDAARTFYDEQRGLIVDARAPELFAKEHIPGAVNCFAWELEVFLPSLLERVSLENPMLIYCAGENCEDSQFLAQTMRELGFGLLYVFEGGIEGWIAAGLELETGVGSGGTADTKLTVKRVIDFSRYAPDWLWLVGEFVLLGFGIMLLVQALTGRSDGVPARIGVKLVGLMFVLASLHKIASPAQFAGIVDNYRILPPLFVNFVAVVLPWVELLCGMLLLAAVARGGAAIVIAGLTFVFIMAISFNIARGLDFDCGCFGSGHTPPWRLLIRDIGLLFCCVPAFFARAQSPD